MEGLLDQHKLDLTLGQSDLDHIGRMLIQQEALCAGDYPILRLCHQILQAYPGSLQKTGARNP